MTVPVLVPKTQARELDEFRDKELGFGFRFQGFRGSGV